MAFMQRFLISLLLYLFCVSVASAEVGVVKFKVHPAQGDSVWGDEITQKLQRYLDASALYATDVIWDVYPRLRIDRGGVALTFNLLVDIQERSSSLWLPSQSYSVFRIFGPDNRDGLLDDLLRNSAVTLQDYSVKHYQPKPISNPEPEQGW